MVMRGYLDRGYSVVKMKIGGASIEEDRKRIEAVLTEIGSQAKMTTTQMATATAPDRTRPILVNKAAVGDEPLQRPAPWF